MTPRDPAAVACPSCNHQRRSHQPYAAGERAAEPEAARNGWCITCGDTGPCRKPDGVSLADRQRIARRMIG